ncbi:MAG: hypothetical protein KGZ96_06450 [Clostridia bacterium]|nr:hypothetical protein [Clostridia bacterium]
MAERLEKVIAAVEVSTTKAILTCEPGSLLVLKCSGCRKTIVARYILSYGYFYPCYGMSKQHDLEKGEL